jgi:hypothetical protein
MPIVAEHVVALENELRTAVRLLEYGLAALQEIDAANDFYQRPLLLLASGSERLCKCALLLSFERTAGAFPTQGELKKWGHDVRSLTEAVRQECFTTDYLRIPAAAEDEAFLRSDAVLQGILACLSDFGSGGRYYELDVISGASPGGPSPDVAWMNLEMTIVKADSSLAAMLHEPSALGRIYDEIRPRLQMALERYLRALCRLFTLGPISKEGRRFSGAVGAFLFLRDDQLGVRRYA